MSSVCKYCGRVELIWDDAHKSKSGKHIPLEKASGLPHQCNENPYPKQQKQQEQDNNPLAPVSDESVERGITAFTMMTDLIKEVEEVKGEIKHVREVLGNQERLFNQMLVWTQQINKQLQQQ